MKAIKIKMNYWDEEQLVNGEMKTVQMDTAKLIKAMVQLSPPQRLPTGLDAFDIMRDIYYALEKAEIDGEIIFQTNTYNWIKEHLFRQIPARWGLIPDLAEAIDLIRNGKEIELETQKT